MSETNAQKVQEVIIAGMSKTVANYDYAMSELEALVAANNMHAALRIDQGLEKPNPATFFGKGKVVERSRSRQRFAHYGHQRGSDP